MPNRTKPLAIEIVDANITSLRICGNIIDIIPPLFKGLIIAITIKVILHHKMDVIK